MHLNPIMYQGKATSAETMDRSRFASRASSSPTKDNGSTFSCHHLKGVNKIFLQKLYLLVRIHTPRPPKIEAASSRGVRSLSSKTLDVYSIDEQVVNNERICTPGCGHSGNQLQEKNPETRQNLCGDNSTYISKSQMMMRISSPLEEGLCTNDSPASKLPDLDTPASSSASRYLPKKKKETHLHTQPEEANLCSQRSNP